MIYVTKKITTMKKVWICDLNCHKFGELLLWVSLGIVDVLGSYIKDSKKFFSKEISKH